MSSFKQYWKIILYVIILIIFIPLISLFVSWKTSPRFARFEISLALQNRDSSICDKYYDYARIVDYAISQSLNEMEDNPFGAIAYTMASNMRPTLINSLQTSTKESFERGSIYRKNILKIFWNSYNNKSDESAVKVVKIGKNKEEFYNCPIRDNQCYLFTWEKIEGKWKITQFESGLRIKDVFK